MAVDNTKVEDNVRVEIDAATSVAVVTINRPQVLNALNSATLDELDRCLADLGRNPACRAIVFKGPRER